MEDTAIVALYWQRDEEAIAASEEKYGPTCRKLSYNILQSLQDAEECVNDTWHRAWDTMPPQKPHSLGAYLCRIARNLSIDRWRARRSKKRGEGLEELVLELEECVSSVPSAEEEWEAHNIQIRVWYEVKSQTESHLSLAVMGTENWTSAYQETRYYNFDLKNGRLLTLKDILGDDYKRIADEEIRAQMAEREKEGAVYFEDFSGIDENTSFYLDEAGRPVVVFGAYAIAPGSEGTQEFVIAAAQEETDLGALVSLLGMKDEDTAGLFGGGEENWTEDKSFYIGRRFAADVYGTPCRIFTTCGEDKTVESVSVWIVGGEREVTETEADEWEARITDFVGAGPAGDEEISEGGNKNLRWTKDGTAITLHQMKDILTVSLQPAVGELK